MGSSDVVVFDQQRYPVVKEFFDRVHAADGHTLVLRRTEAGQ
jgi:hypothetical protein